MPYCMKHALSPLNRHPWNRVAVFSVMHMYVAISDGRICMPLNNLYVYMTYNSFADMSHSCVYMSSHSYLTSLAAHTLILIYMARNAGLGSSLVKRSDGCSVPAILNSLTSGVAPLASSLMVPMWRARLYMPEPLTTNMHAFLSRAIAVAAICLYPIMSIMRRRYTQSVHTRTHCKTRSLCC